MGQSDSDSNSDDELQSLVLHAPEVGQVLQSMWAKSKLPTNYKIPWKAWNLLTPEAREAYTTARSKILGRGETGGGGGLSPNSTEARVMTKPTKPTLAQQARMMWDYPLTPKTVTGARLKHSDRY